jgi:hypothetical protein
MIRRSLMCSAVVALALVVAGAAQAAGSASLWVAPTAQITANGSATLLVVYRCDFPEGGEMFITLDQVAPYWTEETAWGEVFLTPICDGKTHQTFIEFHSIAGPYLPGIASSIGYIYAIGGDGYVEMQRDAIRLLAYRGTP